jgi:hypothetical protein
MYLYGKLATVSENALQNYLLYAMIGQQYLVGFFIGFLGTRDKIGKLQL